MGMRTEGIDKLQADRADFRNLVLSLGIVGLAMLFTWPFANLAFGDDTAYAHIALRLARTGELAYNGWEAMPMIAHAYWGALFIKSFGFSFDCLRLSTFPFALASVALCYALTRRMGLSPRKAFLATVCFGLSPLFLSQAVSYMTDVPGLFFMFAAFYCFVRAAEETAKEEGRPRGYAWFVLGLVLGYVGGTGRQSVWFVPLVVLPHLFWIRRRTRFGTIVFTSWLVTLAAVAAMAHWFNRQPYIVFQPSILKEIAKALSTPFATLNLIARFLLTLLLLTLPAALPLVVRAARDSLRSGRKRQILMATLLMGVFLAILFHPSLASIPWTYSTLDWSGISGDAPLPGRPIVLTKPVRAVVAVAVYVAGCLLLGELTNARELARRVWAVLVDKEGKQFALAAMSQLCVFYFAFFMIRSADFAVFDRYLLPMIPWAATVFFLWCGADEHSEKIWKRATPYSWAVLGVLAFYAIASTQDLWALARARAAAARKLELAGVPRTAIDAGFEYNIWTQLMITGRMNTRYVVNPPGAYNPAQSMSPDVVPQYRLEYALTPETEATPFSSVPYRSILPPFHKQVRIDKLKDSQKD